MKSADTPGSAPQSGEPAVHLDLAPVGSTQNLRFETRVHGQTVHILRNNHVHWITSSQEPRQRAYVLEDHYTGEGFDKPAGSTSRRLTLTIDSVEIDGTLHPQKVRDEKGREWTLSDDFRCYLTEEMRRAKEVSAEV